MHDVLTAGTDAASGGHLPTGPDGPDGPDRRAELLRHLRGLELRSRRLVQGSLGGAYRSVYRGSGIEFAEARPYVPGDDVRRIDWNVTARNSEPWVKEYVEERELTVVTAVDVSASTGVGHLPGGRLAAAAACCALLSLAATEHHDRAGLLLFSDRVERYVEPRRTTRHAMRLVHEVLTAAPGSEPQAHPGTSIAVAADTLAATLRRRSVIFLITDAIDEGYEQSLRALARRHDVTVCVLDDPADRALPNVGLVELRDAESDTHTLVDSGDPRVRAAYARAAAQHAAERDAMLDAAGVARVLIPLDRDPLEPLIHHIRARASHGVRPANTGAGR